MCQNYKIFLVASIHTKHRPTLNPKYRDFTMLTCLFVCIGVNLPKKVGGRILPLNDTEATKWGGGSSLAA